MAPLAFYASEPQYLDHLAPTWRHLQEATFYVDRDIVEHAEARGLPAVPVRWPDTPSRALWVVASPKDAKRVAARTDGHLVAVCHGAGHTWRAAAFLRRGVAGRTRLILTPNQESVRMLEAFNPGVPVRAVGAPFLDDLKPRRRRRRKTPVVAFAFHWNCRTVPETKWAWPHYRDEIARLAARDDLPFRIIGHGHPRAWAALGPWWGSLGVEAVRDFHEVLERADLFVCDNSSAQYISAAHGIPQVVLNTPWYRRDVRQGLRCWDGVPGVQVDEPEDLEQAILTALEDPPELRELRAEGVRRAFGELDGRAGERAAEAIREALVAHTSPQRTVTLRCERYPQLQIHRPQARFQNGVARVPEQVARVLLAAYPYIEEVPS